MRQLGWISQQKNTFVFREGFILCGEISQATCAKFREMKRKVFEKEEK
jgi:hypothetical protein